MNTETRKILTRWQSLKDADGMRKATLVGRGLWVAELMLGILVVCAVIYHMSPIFVAAVAVLFGWVLAEKNALRTRLAQWPIFQGYLDWKRVRQDLGAEGGRDQGPST